MEIITEDTIAIPISEASQAGEARRMAISIANLLGFDETKRGKLSIAVTEIGNNLVQHAKEGVLMFQSLKQNDIPGIAVLALDKGPGMADISKCLEDGFSTKGTLGYGMGAIYRLSDAWEIYSIPEQGTALLIHFWAKEEGAFTPHNKLETGAVCLPKAGELVSGDAWAIYQQSDRSLVMVADGLGHGTQAAEASRAAVRIFSENSHRTPQEIIELAHQGLRHTRGAAMAIAEINFARQEVLYAGVGNIVGTIFSSENSQNLVSYNGTVGHELRKLREFSHQWRDGGVLVMHSDGIGTQWRWERYPGLIRKHPQLISGILYRDYNRSRDDATVLVTRQRMGA